MTAKADPAANGAAVTDPPSIPPPGPPPTDSDRITQLEETVARMAQALAALLSQQYQPQVQQGIFNQLTGQVPTGP